MSFFVGSEIGHLRKVMLHRPGVELERIIPRDLQSMLFDDIPWLKAMRKEHDNFARILEENGARVVYLEDYLAVALADPEAATALIKNVVQMEVSRDEKTEQELNEYLLSLTPLELAQVMIHGLSTKGIAGKKQSLADYLAVPTDYYFYPLPNAYFMRDPAAVIGGGLALGVMQNPIRRRESYLQSLLYQYHPDFAGLDLYYDNNRSRMPLEGGDILVLSEKTVAVGCSQRSSAHAIELLAEKILAPDQTIQNILAIQIPVERAFMHLDTVLTMVDRNKFIVYPGIIDFIRTVEIRRGPDGHLHFRNFERLSRALETVLDLEDLQFIYSGGGDSVVAAREQWNDATNTLAIAPGKVIAYNRNVVSNDCLREQGIEVIEIEGGELVRGRGGPRCMSMPLQRSED
ncbi:MAG: arginine deiminase [Clostridiales bacterium]|nr:arginine deiminase [Clostridiales bacterium]